MKDHKRKMIAPIVVSVLMILYYVIYFGFLMSLLDGIWRYALGILPVVFSIVFFLLKNNFYPYKTICRMSCNFCEHIFIAEYMEMCLRVSTRSRFWARYSSSKYTYLTRTSHWLRSSAIKIGVNPRQWTRNKKDLLW